MKRPVKAGQLHPCERLARVALGMRLARIGKGQLTGLGLVAGVDAVQRGHGGLEAAAPARQAGL